MCVCVCVCAGNAMSSKIGKLMMDMLMESANYIDVRIQHEGLTTMHDGTLSTSWCLIQILP